MASGKGLSFKALLQLESKQFRQGLNNVKKQLQGFAGFVKSAFAIGSITAFGRQMVQVSKDFENAMVKVKAVSNASTEDFAAMQKEAKRLGETTRYTATEAAGALENLTRNGLSAQQATKALSGVLQLAQANAIELANAADILTNTMNAFGLSVNDTARINDVLSSTAANAATNINELYEAMVVAGPYSKIMGKSIEETAAAIGTLANNGIKGSTAGKSVAAMYQRLSAITPKAAKAMAQYGIEVDEATIKSSSLVDILRTLSQSGIGNSVQALTEIFGKNFAGDISQLINNFQEVDSMLGTLRNSAGTTARMFEDGVGSVTKELDTLRSKYEGLLITIGNKTSGIVKGAVRLLQNLIDNFKSVTGTLLNIASVVVPLLGKRIITFGRTAIATFNAVKTGALSLKMAMGDIVGVVATLVTWLGTALYGAWRRSTQAMRDAKKGLEDVKAEGKRTQQALDGLLEQLGPETDKTSLSGIVKRLCELFPDFASAIRAAAEEAARTGNWDALKKTLQDIADLQDSIKRKGALENLFDAQVNRLATWATNNGVGQKNYDNGLRLIFKDIEKQLKTQDFSKDSIHLAFEDIIREVVKFGSTVDDVNRVLKIWGVQLSKSDIEYIFNDIRGTDWVKKYPMEQWSSFAAGRWYRAINTGQEIHKTDSTITAGSYQIFKKEFDTSIDNISAQFEEGTQEFSKAAHEAVENFKREVEGLQLDDQQQKEVDFYSRKYPAVTGGGGGNFSSGDDNKLSGTSKTIKDVIDNFRTKAAELSNALKEGLISEEEYETQINDLKDSTWKAIAVVKDFRDIIASFGMPDVAGWLKSDYQERQGVASSDAAYDAAANQQYQRITQQQSLNDFKVPKMPTRDTTFDYMLADSAKTEANIRLMQDYANTVKDLANNLAEAIKSGDFSEVIGDATTQLGILREVVKQVTADANDMQHALNLSELAEKLKEYQDELKELNSQEVDTFTNLIGVFERLYNAVTKISEALGSTMTEKEKEQWQAVFDVVNGGLEIFEAFKTVVEALSLAQEIASKRKQVAAAAEVTSNAMVAASNGTVAASELAKSAAESKSAVAGAASSVAGTPVIGPALAAAAIGAISGALLASLAKFANGGVVGGNSFSGDHNIVRVNSGELILNQSQAGTLYKAIKSGNLGGGGNVQFKIRGSDLVGAIDAFNSRKRG